MKKLLLISSLLVTLFILGGCSSDSESSSVPNNSEDSSYSSLDYNYSNRMLGKWTFSSSELGWNKYYVFSNIYKTDTSYFAEGYIDKIYSESKGTLSLSYSSPRALAVYNPDTKKMGVLCYWADQLAKNGSIFIFDFNSTTSISGYFSLVEGGEATYDGFYFTGTKTSNISSSPENYSAFNLKNINLSDFYFDKIEKRTVTAEEHVALDVMIKKIDLYFPQ